MPTPTEQETSAPTIEAFDNAIAMLTKNPRSSLAPSNPVLSLGWAAHNIVHPGCKDPESDAMEAITYLAAKRRIDKFTYSADENTEEAIGTVDAYLKANHSAAFDLGRKEASEIARTNREKFDFKQHGSHTRR